MCRQVIPLLLAVAPLLGGAQGGCGLAAPAANVEEGPGTPATGISWTGVDSRPYAVGTTATLSFEASGLGDCCSLGYTVSSTAPEVIGVTDLGNQTVQVQALGEGAATIQINALVDGVLVGELPLTAKQPATVIFGDPSHLAAGIEGDTDLPPQFSLVQGSQQIVQAVIEDAAGDPLASQGLASCASSAGLTVSKEEPEKIVMEGLLATEGSNLTCGLTANPATDIVYEVRVVAAAQNATFEKRTTADGSVIALVNAWDENNDETFGVGAWIFLLDGADTGTPLGASAVSLTFPTQTAPGTETLIALSETGSLTATTSVP